MGPPLPPSPLLTLGVTSVTTDANIELPRRPQQQNQCYALRLPFEMWALIAEHHRREVHSEALAGAVIKDRLVNPHDYLTLTQVCSYIRDILLSTPSLWATIASTPKTPIELVEVFLHRSQPYNVEIWLIAHPNTPYHPRFQKLLERILPRVHSLSLALSPACEELGEIGNEWVPCTSIAPVLETISIERSIISGGHRDEFETIPYPLTAIELPNVKELFVSNFRFEPFRGSLSSQITHLEIINAETGQPVMTLVEILAILEPLRNLEVLRLENAMVPVEIDYDELDPVVLPRLSYLCLINHCLGPVRILQHLIIPSTTHIQLKTRSILDPHWIKHIMSSVSDTFRGREMSAGSPQIFSGLAVYPLDKDLIVDAYVGISSLEELTVSPRPQLHVEIPNCKELMELLFQALQDLQLSGLKVFYIANNILRRLSEDTLASFLYTTANLQEFYLANFTTEATPPMPLTEIMIYFGLNGGNSYRDALANLNCAAELREPLRKVLDACERCSLSLRDLETMEFYL